MYTFSEDVRCVEEIIEKDLLPRRFYPQNAAGRGRIPAAHGRTGTGGPWAGTDRRRTGTRGSPDLEDRPPAGTGGPWTGTDRSRTGTRSLSGPKAVPRTGTGLSPAGTNGSPERTSRSPGSFGLSPATEIERRAPAGGSPVPESRLGTLSGHRPSASAHICAHLGISMRATWIVPICPSERRPDDGAPGEGVGQGLGRLYATVLPLQTVEVTEMSRKRPHNLNLGLGTTVP